MEEESYRNTPSERKMDNLQLLGSILMCFPEISRITWEPKKKQLIFDFSILGEIDREEFTASCKRLEESLGFFRELEGVKKGDMDFFLHQGKISILRDIETISCNEIQLLTELMREYFTGFLLCGEEFYEVEENFLINQFNLIDPRIVALREKPWEYVLTGVREERKIMVFDR